VKVVWLALASLLALVASVGAAAAPAGAAATPTIAAPPNVVVGEAAGSVNLPVTLSAPSTNPVSVNFSVPGGGCNNPAQGATGTLTFAPGVTSRTVTVTLNNCLTSGLQFFTFTLSGAVNGVIADPTTQVDVVGDPAATSTTPGLYVRDAVVDANAGSIDVPVLLGGPAGATSSSTVTVKYATTNGSAVAGTDYTATSGTLTFGPGETVKNVVVPIIDRSGSAPTRRFGVVLSTPNNAVITDGTGVVTIGASGAAPVATPNISAPANLVVGEADGYVDLPVTLSAPSTNPVSVNFSVPGGGCNNPAQGATGTLTFVPGQTTQAVRVFLNNCGVAGSFTLPLSGATNGTITQSTTMVTVPVSNTAPGSPTAVKGVVGNGYVTVRFTAPKSDGGDPVNGYTVTASPGGMTATGIGSPIIVVGLTNGTAYTFKVTATNPEGTSQASSASAPVTPTGPGFVVATTSLLSATRGQAYGPVTLAVSGTTPSTPPHTTTVAWGQGPATSSGPALPQGMKLSAAGVLSGTPSSGLATGTYTVCVKATETVTTVVGGKTTTSKTTAYGLIPLSIS
jgi:chitinase